MQVSLVVPTTGRLARPDIIGAAVQRAEEHGFAGAWVADHVLLPSSPSSGHPYSGRGWPEWSPDTGWIDPLLALAWIAAHTTQFRLGTCVLIMPLRPALLVAKAAGSLDHLSGGRLRLGVGVGWLKEEYDALGRDFRRRGRLLDEQLSTLRAAWAEDPIHVDAGRVPYTMQPKPPQGARLPILIGGESDAAVRRAVALGDGWIPSNIGPAMLGSRLSRVEALLAHAGRSRDAFAVVARPGRSADVDRELAFRYAAVGVDELVLDLDRALPDEAALLARIDAIARELGPHLNGT